MTLTQIADTADLIAAAGVIVSLLFVYLELRRGNRETSHHQSQHVIAKMNDYRGLTNDPALADIVLRGRKGLSHLTDAENLTFDRYLRQVVTTIMAVKTTLRTGHVERAVVDYLVWTSIRDELMHDGSNDWYADPKTKRLFGRSVIVMIDEALGKSEEEMEGAWTSSQRRLWEAR
jgi:hypothetical protein